MSVNIFYFILFYLEKYSNTRTALSLCPILEWWKHLEGFHLQPKTGGWMVIFKEMK